MATTKVRRVRVGTRLSVELRARLTKYCAASGISERTIIEDALRKHLDSKDETTLFLRRLDRIERALARDHRDLELLSEAFGRYIRLWFTAHAPNTTETGKASTRAPPRRTTGISRSTWVRSSRRATASLTTFPSTRLRARMTATRSGMRGRWCSEHVDRGPW
jgi:hypothetical protein